MGGISLPRDIIGTGISGACSAFAACVRAVTLCAAVLCTSTANAAAPFKPEAKQEATQPWVLPPVDLINQDGQVVDLGQTLHSTPQVAIQFIFTRCGLICPLLGFQFGQLRRALGDRAGAQVQLISISVDPLHDTPAALRDWAARYQYGPGWTLLTGEKPKVDAVLKALQAFNADIQEHSSLILIGDTVHQRWQRLDASTSAAAILSALDQLVQQ